MLLLNFKNVSKRQLVALDLEQIGWTVMPTLHFLWPTSEFFDFFCRSLDLHSSLSPSGKVYDPIYEASIKQNNIDLHTIYCSTNGMLTLISGTPFWAVSLKLVHYTRWDPGDICLLLRWDSLQFFWNDLWSASSIDWFEFLYQRWFCFGSHRRLLLRLIIWSIFNRNGMVLSGTIWTPETFEDWLFRNCWPMGYHNFDIRKKADMRARILHTIELLSKWSSAVKPPEKTISAHDVMGRGWIWRQQWLEL